MNHKWFFLIFMLTSLTMTSGCWDKRELNELALISAFAIDLNEEGKYIGTFQIINPGNVAGGLQGGGGQNSTVTVYSATGENLIEVEGHITNKLSRQPYYAHADLIVIGDQLAREEGITKVFDALERGNELRKTAKVIIARDTQAGEVLNVLTDIDRIPAEQVVNNLESAEKLQGEYQSINVGSTINYLVSPGNEPLITGFTLKGDPEEAKKIENIQTSEAEATLEPTGLGVIKDGKLIDWLDGETARGSLWVLDKIQSTRVNIRWREEKEALSYQIVRQKTKVSAQLGKGKPKISIKVRAEGDLLEVRVPVEITNPSVLDDIEKEIEKEIKDEIEKAVHHAQKNKSDNLGFGDAVHRADFKKWNKIKKEWNNTSFSALETNVTVDVFIRRTGLRSKSYISDINK